MTRTDLQNCHEEIQALHDRIAINLGGTFECPVADACYTDALAHLTLAASAINKASVFESKDSG